MNQPTVTLSDMEYLWGIQGAIIRQTADTALGRKPRNNGGRFDAVPTRLRKDVIGFLGELAFAKFMGLYPTGAFNFRDPDVGEWEVKTRPEHEYRGEPAALILQSDTVPDSRYALLTGSGPSFVVRGYILGRDALKVAPADLANNGCPAIWIPQTMLTPVPLAEAA